MNRVDVDGAPAPRAVIWINGAFGAGKTTVAKRLRAEWPEATLFDPEKLARLIRNATPRQHRPNDYQDSPLWRRLTVQAISGLSHVSKTVIVPMTLVNERYFDETIGVLRESGVDVHHFALTASPATLRRRLLKRQLTRFTHPRSTRWALNRVDRCCTSLAGETFREQIVTDGLSVDGVVTRITSRVDASARRSCSSPSAMRLHSQIA